MSQAEQTTTSRAPVLRAGTPSTGARKLHLVSLGCPKNRVDSEVMVGKLLVSDFELVDDPADAEVVTTIKELLETRVRPAVAQDGGDITFHSWDHEEGVVRLNMRGSCAGCPSSTITLKQGIENMLRHYVPEVNRVEQVV